MIVGCCGPQILVRSAVLQKTAGEGGITQSRSFSHGLKVEPPQISFEEQLRNKPGLLRKRDFRVSIRSNKGYYGLMFEKGEIIEIYVKVNIPSYFYIVGHTLAGEEPFSCPLKL